MIYRCLLLYFLLITLISGSAHGAELTLGTTFSARQCDYLGLDWKETYKAVLDLKFDVIRLGAYWEEIEKEKDHYDFSRLDWEIQEAKAKGIPIILTVGMKAPRWPEYFIPHWVLKEVRLGCGAVLPKDEFLRERTLMFIERVMEQYGKEKAIHYIQVENEALNRFGGRHWMIDKNFLQKEVELVRKLDRLKRPIILTTATYPNRLLAFVVKLFTHNNAIQNNIEYCDILGVNVYPMFGQTFGQGGYYVKTDQRKRLDYFKRLIEQTNKAGKKLWVTELQAEPWEPGILAHRSKRKVPTGWPESTKLTLQELRRLGYETFLFWGVEYWYDQKTNHDNPAWWNTIRRIIRDKSIRFYR